MRLRFWRRDSASLLTVDAIRARVAEEARQAAREREPAREAFVDAPTEQLPKQPAMPPMRYDGHGELPRWVRRAQMESSDRYGGPEVTR